MLPGSISQRTGRLVPESTTGRHGEGVEGLERVERLEYVGGPRDGTARVATNLPDVIPDTGGEYERSVRCADDGAMRYVWRGAPRSGMT